MSSISYHPSRCRRVARLAATWCAVLLFTSLPAHAIADGTVGSEYAVKAAIIFKIAKFVSWPEHAFASESEPLFICLPKDDPMTEAMSALSGKNVHGRVLSVRHFDFPTTLPTGCQVLFVSEQPGNTKFTLLKSLAEQPVLTVSDDTRFALHGGIVTLEIKQNRVQFAINVDASDSAGLSISAQLLQLAKITGSGNKSR